MPFLTNEPFDMMSFGVDSFVTNISLIGAEKVEEDLYYSTFGQQIVKQSARTAFAESGLYRIFTERFGLKRRLLTS